MDAKRRSILLTFTVLSFAAAVLMGFRYIGEYGYYGILEFAEKNQEAGICRWLSWLFNSPWTDTLVEYACLMGAAFLPVYLLICWLPKDTKEPRALPAKDFVIGTVMAMGLGYTCNMLGTWINYLISTRLGGSFLDMNPVTEMMESMSPSMVIYACIVGPVMEELFCRGFLLKRARVFGDWTAVVFTAIIFGLMHGNIAQFLYATVIGLILGYVTVKTNSIRSAIGIHIVVNTYNTILGVVEESLFAWGLDLLAYGVTFAALGIMLLLIIVGFILAVKYGRLWYRQMLYHDGPPSDDKMFVFVNPGFLVYLILCLIEFGYYLK